MSLIGCRNLFVILVVAATLVGCGRKTLPIPPHAVIPQAITNLHFSQDESRVVLSWTYPSKTTIGTELKNIESFQVFRAIVPEQDFCETCPVPFRSPVEVEFDQIVQDREKKRARYTEVALRSGHRYLYKVRTKAGWRIISDDSNVVSFLWESPTVAPTNLRLTPGDRGITLSWQEVTRRTDGSSLDIPPLYQVYRRTDKKKFTPVGEAVLGSEYRDIGLVNGRTYEYNVRAVSKQKTNVILGIASSILSGTPIDLTAPIPPHNLAVVTVDDGVKLMWPRGLEADIAGYRIFRRSDTGDKRVLIGETGAKQTFFVDNSVPAKQNLLYSITSFDRARPANESIFSKEVHYESF